MLRATLLLLGLMAGPAFAHTGHIGDLAGHDHWVAGAAIAAAVLIGLRAALKDRAAKAAAAEDRAEDDAPEEEEQTA